MDAMLVTELAEQQEEEEEEEGDEQEEIGEGTDQVVELDVVDVGLEELVSDGGGEGIGFV